MFFVKDFSDSPVNHRRPPVNHRRLAVNHRRLVTKKWFFFIHFLDDSEHSKTNEHLNIFWYFWSDSLVNHRRPPVNHRRLAVNHRRLVTKKWFFFIHFLDDSEHSKTNEHLKIFWYFWSDSLVNHRKLAVNHRRLVTKKKKWPSQKKIFFFYPFSGWIRAFWVQKK